jgi:hypothetical protein
MGKVILVIPPCFLWNASQSNVGIVHLYFPTPQLYLSSGLKFCFTSSATPLVIRVDARWLPCVRLLYSYDDDDYRVTPRRDLGRCIHHMAVRTLGCVVIWMKTLHSLLRSLIVLINATIPTWAKGCLGSSSFWYVREVSWPNHCAASCAEM